jgi:hypothetical protein
MVVAAAASERPDAIREAAARRRGRVRRQGSRGWCREGKNRIVSASQPIWGTTTEPKVTALMKSNRYPSTPDSHQTTGYWSPNGTIHLYCWSISTPSKEAQSKIQTIKTVTPHTICRVSMMQICWARKQPTFLRPPPMLIEGAWFLRAYFKSCHIEYFNAN